MDDHNLDPYQRTLSAVRPAITDRFDNMQSLLVSQLRAVVHTVEGLKSTNSEILNTMPSLATVDHLKGLVNHLST